MGTVVFYDEKFDWGSNKAHHSYVSDWFDKTKYHKYDMSWINTNERYQRGPQRKEFTELRWWIQDNLVGEVLISYGDKRSSGGGVTVYLYFQHDTDLMAFKLKWL